MKKYYILVLLMFSFLFSNSQTFFGNQNSLTATTRDLSSIFSADLDGDGDSDILSSSRGDDKIAWYENIGNGNFGPQQVIESNAILATSVYSFDLDGDGDNDVLANASSIYGLNWYENDGNGKFSQKKTIDSHSFANSIFADDMDSDGDIDVITTSNFQINWFKNINNSFEEQEKTGTANEAPTFIYTSDLDNDGDKDIIVAGYSSVDWHENDGFGNFGPTQNIAVKGLVYSISVSDVDGDNDNDIILAPYNNDKIIWYENDGTGNFISENIITSDSEYVRSVKSTDIDNDGDMDVIIASYYDITWWENDGTGQFTQSYLIETKEIPCESYISCSDPDNDGDIDIISADTESDYDRIVWYENDGNGIFDSIHVVNVSSDIVVSVHAADIDNNGYIDILSTSIIDNKLAWYKNEGSDINKMEQQVISQKWYIHFKDLFTADLDLDGDQDVLTASEYDNQISWFENLDGNGNFGEINLISNNAESTTCVYSTDIDNDGDYDVLSASKGDNKIAWYENLGLGQFGNQIIIDSDAPSASYVNSSDLDMDGDQDVLSLSMNKIAWYENDGSGNFSSANIITDLYLDATDLIASDLDNDGDNDVICNDYSTYGNITWFENDGSGNFSNPRIVKEIYQPSTFFPIDIDKDGDIDIVSQSGTYNNKNIEWHENDGNGNFINHHLLYDDINVISIYACDLTNDGYPEVISGSYHEGIVAWYENFQISNSEDLNVCPNSEAHFSVSTNNAISYKWQMNDGSGYIDLEDNNVYSGTNTEDLTISAATSLMNGNTYRCLISFTNDTFFSDYSILYVDTDKPDINSSHPDQIIGDGTTCSVNLSDYTTEVTATDNCDTELEISQIPIPGTVISGNSNTIKLTVKDDAGNQNHVEFNVEVTDNSYPNITCIENQNIIVGQELNYTIIGTEFDPVSANDNCNYSISNNLNSLSTLEGEILNVGNTNIVWTIEDGNGNISSCNFDVSITSETGIIDNHFSDIIIKPNPTKNIFYIESQNKDIQFVRITDITGRTLIKRKHINPKEEFDLSDYGKGIYIVNVYTDEVVFSSKIVKQ